MEKIRTPKILLLSSIPPPLGGISIWTDMFIKHPCIEKNMRLLNMSHPSHKDIRKHGIKRNAKASISSIWLFLAMIYRVITDWPDIIHICCCSGLSFYRGILFCLVGKLFRKKTVLHFHSNLNKYFEGNRCILSFIFKKLHYIIDDFVVLNRVDEETLKESKFRGSIHKINNFINDIFFIKKRITANNQMFRLLYVGWIIPYKGLNELILSVRYLNNVKLQLIGPIVDDRYFQLLMSQIKSLGLSEKVQYHNPLSQSDLVEKYLNSDAFVFPSYEESFSLVLAEAMAMGLPVICTEVGCACELKHEENALIIPQKDIIALQDAIVLLRNDLALRLRMSENNYEYAMQTFKINGIIGQWLKLYGELAP